MKHTFGERAGPGDVLELLVRVLDGYRLKQDGIHGPRHWARVLLNGLTVCDITGADRDVVVMFSLFHDARRMNDWIDHEHGSRGGALARQLLRGRSGWDGVRIGILEEACRDHTDVKHHDNTTIQTCWDADRLDLPRVGADVNTDYLGSWAAAHSDTVQAAGERARQGEIVFPRLFSIES